MSRPPGGTTLGLSCFLGKAAEDYPDCLRDESRLVGHASSISFAVTEEDVRTTLALACRRNLPVTVQGGRTGITGGAVPQGGHILNLSHMKKILGFREEPARSAAFITVQPGLTLAELRGLLAEDGANGLPGNGLFTRNTKLTMSPFFLPPDPTEVTATLGGMVNCNASGSLSFRYGPVRFYVERLRVVLSDGRVLDLRRGVQVARGRRIALVAEDGTKLEGTLPSYKMPAVKNAAGYFVRDDMDLLDLFVGAEGTLGVVTEIELRLLPAPPVVWGVMAFVPEEETAVSLVQEARRTMPGMAALEFFDVGALGLLRKHRSTNPSLAERIPSLPNVLSPAVYIEYHGSSVAEVETQVMTLAASLPRYGVDEASTWIADRPAEIARLKDFRHAIPEAVNREVDERRKSEPALTKLGTDLAVPDGALERVMRMYREGLADLGLEAVIFGHIGDNHLHVNIIARDMDEYRRGRELYLNWARAVVGMGGTVSAEHGIGKLKREFLEILYGAEGVRMMKETKRLFDPQWILNRGNLFEAV